MIIDGGVRYENKPNQFKQVLDNICIQNSIKEVKITMSKHLDVIFNDSTGYEYFMKNHTRVFKKDQKIINFNNEKKKSYEIVIKGANYKYYENYTFQLAQMGITEIKRMKKK